MTTKPTKHRCLYEILGVDIKSTPEQIAKGYKKAALKWHPDRNIHNSEEATERFKEVNEAYSVLSDKHERAWYDSVREKLLKGIDPNSQIDPNNIDLTYYISPFAFNGYDDTSNNNENYYKVYNDLFNQIIELEGRNKSKTPKFGNSKSQWSKIRKFYNFWEDFRSIRNFNWTVKWNLNNANNRRERKYMQKENNKLKSEKKKEFEQMVSKLVKFVKKRDPRFQKHLIDLEKERIEQEKKQKEYEEELRQIEKEIREEENRKRQELYLQKLQQNNQNIDDIFDDNSNDMIHNDMYHCIACNKYFKTQNAKQNHKQSKKHLKNVENLRKQLKLEEKLLIKSMNTSENTSENGNEEHEEPNILLDEMLAKQLQSEFDIDFSFLNNKDNNENNNNNNENNNNNNGTDNDNNTNNKVNNNKENNDNLKNNNNHDNTNSKLQSDDLDHLLAQQLEQEEIKSMSNFLNNSVPLIDEKDKLIIETEISDKDLDKLLSQGIKMEELLDDNGNIDVKKINQMKRRMKKLKRQKNRNPPDSDTNSEDEIVVNTNKNNNNMDKIDENDMNNNNDNDREFKKVKRRRRRKKDQLKAQHEYKSTIFSCLYCANKFKTKHHLINHLRANPKHKKPYEQNSKR